MQPYLDTWQQFHGKSTMSVSTQQDVLTRVNGAQQLFMDSHIGGVHQS